MRARNARKLSLLGAGAIGAAASASAMLLAGLGGASESARDAQPHDQMQMIKKLQGLTPAKGYLAARKDLDRPQELLGGPVNVRIEQNGGGVFVALPDKRELDHHVFGTPEMPRRFGGTPGITGVPPAFRNHEGDQYTSLQKNTPFGDKFTRMGGADLSIEATDATATDAARTTDTLEFSAEWRDRSGNTYSVRCNRVMPHGLEFPTFGGVMTNHILHGFTGLGTPLMPTEYTYFAFWGMGNVYKNGEKVDGPRLVHGMLTEYVRGDGYRLVHDDEVEPQRRHFHLMVSPFKPDKSTGHFVHENVSTGFELPNGMELPFWHVMFENLDIESSRG